MFCVNCDSFRYLKALKQQNRIWIFSSDGREMRKFMEWKPLTYHGEYFGNTHEISDTGLLRNSITKKELRQNANKEGYLTTVISRGRKRKIAVKIHRAVAENFLAKQEGKNIINHKDGNKKNNNILNLEWCTSRENMLHAYGNGLIKNRRLERVRELLENVFCRQNQGIVFRKGMAVRFKRTNSTACMG